MCMIYAQDVFPIMKVTYLVHMGTNKVHKKFKKSIHVIFILLYLCTKFQHQILNNE
jgi:hypothetical protein